MHAVTLILYVAAAVCLAIAATGRVNRVNLVALGLLAWVLVPLIHTARA